MNIPPEVLGLLKNQNRERDIRNAAVLAWRYVLDAKGGQAPPWDFINCIRMMALSVQPPLLEPAEILSEWQKAAWIEYSPDGSQIRITSEGIAKLVQWEQENSEFNTADAHEKIHSLLDDVRNMTEENAARVTNLVRRAEMIITRIFGPASVHLAALRQIKFHGTAYDSAIGRDQGGPFRRGKEAFSDLCKRMLEDLGPEPNVMALKERLVAGQPARNLLKIKNIIGSSTVTGIHDPYTTTASLDTILKLADLETKLSSTLRILGTSKPLAKSTQKKSLVSFLRDINTERNADWEVRTYTEADNPHRRFLVLDDGSVVTCGMSLNHIDKDEALDREPGGSENAKYDNKFFDEKWNNGSIVT